MALITNHPLVSHQDYSTMPSLRRLIKIDENLNWITHYIDFIQTKEQKLMAKVVHTLSDFRRMPEVEVSEDRIYYLADRSKVEYESGLTPGAVPFYQAPDRETFVYNLAHRKIEVIDIHIDHLHPNSNKTYILTGPAFEGPAASLHFNPSASLPSDATPPASMEPTFPPRKLTLRLSLEASPNPTPPSGEINTNPTAYQEYD